MLAPFPTRAEPVLAAQALGFAPLLAPADCLAVTPASRAEEAAERGRLLALQPPAGVAASMLDDPDDDTGGGPAADPPSLTAAALAEGLAAAVSGCVGV